jgi:hypothetical protein
MWTTGWRPSESRLRFWNSGNSHESQVTVDSTLSYQGSTAQKDLDR